MCTSPPGLGGLIDKDSDIDRGDVALCRTVSDEQLNSVMCTSPLGPVDSVMRAVPFELVPLPYVGLGPMSLSTVLFVHPDRMYQVPVCHPTGPILGNVCFLRVLLPGSARTVNDVIRTVNPGGDYVSSLYVRPVVRDRFMTMMIIVTLLQLVLSGSSRREIRTGSSCREVRTGSLCLEVCAGSSCRELCRAFRGPRFCDTRFVI